MESHNNSISHNSSRVVLKSNTPPSWVENNSLLYLHIQNVLRLAAEWVANDEARNILLHSIKHLIEQDLQIWVQAFTHKTANPNVNNSYLSSNGAYLLRYVFSKYLQFRFNEKVNAKECSALIQHYLCAKNITQLSNKLELSEYVYYTSNNKKSAEDTILPSFLSCLHDLCESSKVSGFTWCMVIIKKLFDDVNIDISMCTNYKSQLKEIYDQRNWAQPKYNCSKDDKNEWHVVVLSGKRQMGGGRAFLKSDAIEMAAKEAINTIHTDNGISRKTKKEYIRKESKLTTENNIKLYVTKRNNYGNPQMSEKAGNGDVIYLLSLKQDEYWSIKDPSDSIKNVLQCTHPGYTIYTCSGGTFAISPIASTFYKPETNNYGSGIVIEFLDDNEDSWFLLISDDKPYIANIQGCAENNETFEECIKREVLEETDIYLCDIRPTLIAEYSFTYKNALVDCEYDVVSKIFYARLSYNRVHHLFPNGLVSHQINIVDVASLQIKLDETKYIIAIPASMNMVDVPEKFSEIKVSKTIKGETVLMDADYSKQSHHRQFIDLFKTNSPIIKPPYLKTLTFDVRYDEALAKFNEYNSL